MHKGLPSAPETASRTTQSLTEERREELTRRPVPCLRSCSPYHILHTSLQPITRARSLQAPPSRSHWSAVAKLYLVRL